MTPNPHEDEILKINQKIEDIRLLQDQILGFYGGVEPIMPKHYTNMRKNGVSNEERIDLLKCVNGYGHPDKLSDNLIDHNIAAFYSLELGINELRELKSELSKPAPKDLIIGPEIHEGL
jgi:hypothetical protein